jgi:hypothetical protein
MIPDQDPSVEDEQLSAAERRLLTSAVTGEPVDCRANAAELDDPAQGLNWASERQVRGDLLTDLLTGAKRPGGRRLRAIKLHGVRITGGLNLEAANLTCPLFLSGCHIDKAVNLNEATALAIRMPGCYLPGLRAFQLRTKGDLALDEAIFAEGAKVWLDGAHIGGLLSMNGARLGNPGGRALSASHLIVDYSMYCGGGFTAVGMIDLFGAHVGGELILLGANLANPGETALDLRDATIDHSMLCGEGFTATGEVNLTGAHIRGELGMADVSLTNPGGTALNAGNLTVDQDFSCVDGFTAVGAVDLEGAHIGGKLSLEGATLTNSEGSALFADGMTVNRNMSCRIAATGEVSMAAADIGGELRMNGASLTNPGGTALNAGNLTVGLDMHCTDGFRAHGEILLRSAHIGGLLIMRGASLTNPDGTALNATSITVDQDVLCEGFAATGMIDLFGARIGGHLILARATLAGELALPGSHIGGQLAFDDAELTNAGGTALNAVQITVGQSMLCLNRVAVAGGIEMAGARIGGNLSFAGASLANPDGMALNGHNLAVVQDMLCMDEFTATGEVRLGGAQISGQFLMAGALLANPDGQALVLDAAEMSALLLLPRQPPVGAVSLAHAKVGRFYDDPANWPALFDLQGFTYDTLASEGVSTRSRLEWLARNRGGYVPQLYDQLVSAYRRAGDERAARTVAIAKQRRRRRAYSPLNWLWYATVGYGYRTWLASIWLVALLAVGTWVFGNVHMIATTTHPPTFQPFAYTADVTIPIVDLGQKSAWEPPGAAVYWSWALTVAGWVLTTAVVAGLTGILKRD